MRELQKKLGRICATNVPVILLGESGVGKNVLSRFIHDHSKGMNGAYVRVNCANPSLSSLELERLSFMEAQAKFSSTSLPRTPEGSPIGTWFFDEVGELSLALQTHVSYSLEEQPYGLEPEPWGRTEPSRLVSSSHRNLRKEVTEGKFRPDLFHRLAVVTLEVPPLRKRPADLLILADYLRSRYATRFGVAEEPFPKKLVERMHYYDWPGNIRELENFVCRFVIFASEEQVLRGLNSRHDNGIAYEMIRPGYAPLKDAIQRRVEELEREMITQALDNHNGNIRKAAHYLGVGYRTLMNKMDAAGLPRTRHLPKARDLAS
jgi:DNA-binding NtrC family response regulator